MRQIALGLAVAAILAGPAAAQMGGGAGGYQSAQTTSTTPIGQLPPVALEWMMRETQRQATRPTSLEDLDQSIEVAVGADLEATGRKERVSKADMAAAMRFEILRTAQRTAKEDLKERRKSPPSDDLERLALQAAEQHVKALDVMVKQARRQLSRKAQSIISD
ncbi:MAG TPA: hypothetical protein VF138_04095 [Caulobacteraceae bacterium]